MRPVALLCLASLVAVAACELAFPFDRSLIPEEGGVSEVDSGGFSEDATLPGEDAQAAPDAETDSSMARDASTNGDAAQDGSQVARDASADGDAAQDGSQDAAGSVDAAADVVVGPDAMLDAGEAAE
jgi:hypothetical protein